MYKFSKKELKEINRAFHQFRTHLHLSEYRKMVLDGVNNSGYLHFESLGEEYFGQTIYHIDAHGDNSGFFAEFIFTLYRLYFAYSRGFVPYVYWGENNLYYEQEGVDGQYNTFLQFFDPVSEIKATDRAAYVVAAKDYHIKSVQDLFDTHGYNISDKYMNDMSEMIRKFIRYNNKTKKYLDNQFENLIGNKKTLAVHYRGTDYKRQYNNHPVFVNIENEISEVEKLMATGKYEQIFLATDEEDAIRVFSKHFGEEKIKSYSDVYRATDENSDSVAFSTSTRPNHRYLLGLEVLRDQYTLTRCDGLVGGVSNLTIVSRLMRKAWYGEYEDLVVINNGICRNGKVFSENEHYDQKR